LPYSSIALITVSARGRVKEPCRTFTGIAPLVLKEEMSWKMMIALDMADDPDEVKPYLEALLAQILSVVPIIII
jgi:hypothetical protein